MSDEQEEPTTDGDAGQTEDAADESSGGALDKDNAVDPSEPSDEKEGGLGDKTDALGGGEPTDPDGKQPESQQHPHGESGR